MKPGCKIWILFLAFLFTKSSGAAKLTPADSSSFDLYETERVNLLTRIHFEKGRIANDFKGSDPHFFSLVDSVSDFILRQQVTKEKRNLYLNRLQLFLTNINRYYSDSYFKSGTYVAILAYYPIMIEWDEKDDLAANIKRYSTFTVKAARLIPNETAAEDFLVDYMNDNPDDIFRYGEEFDDRPFALRVLEKATRLAPESAKRYYTSGNTVSDLLRTSKDPFVKMSLAIYNRYGLRSRAYLLLDEIVKNNLSMAAADSIGNHPEQMFSLQVRLCMQPDAPITYSTNRFIDMYSVDAMRKINLDALGNGFNYTAFEQNTPEEMFQLFCYGYKETTVKTFPGLFELLCKRASANPVSSVMIANMDKEKLKSFVIFCYKNKVLDRLLALVDDSKKEYLLGLTTYEEKPVLTPPVKSFTAQDDIANNKPEDLSPKDVKQARPPKAVVLDTIETPAPVAQTEVKPAVVIPDVVPVPTAPAKKETVAPVIEASNTKAPIYTPPNPAIQPQPVKQDRDTVQSRAVVAATSPGKEAQPVIAKSETPVNTKPDNSITKPVVTTSKAASQPVVAVARPKVEIATAPVTALPAPLKATPNVVPASDIVPLPVPEIIEPIRIVLDERTKTIMGLEKNILQTIQTIPAFINKDYAEEILMYAAQKEPDELFKKISAFKGKFYCKKVLEECAINAPVSLKRYLYNPRETVNYILLYSQNPLVKKIFEINPQLGYHSKPLLLLDDIADGKLSVNQAITISNDPDALFSAMVKIIPKPKYIGKYSINREMRDYSLRFIREINDKIASGARQPFASVENFGSTDLYFLMLYGRDEVFTSTFNGLFNRFIQKLPKDNGEAFMVSVNYNQFRDFISLCANYGTLEEFLTKFSPEQKRELLQLYVSKLETEKDNLSTIVLITEAISNLKDYMLLNILQTGVKKEYERVKAAKNQIGISLYGVLASMISGNAIVEPAWYKKVAQQFKISPATSLASSTLFSEGTGCTEQMYFYNDDDGRSSFINFMNSYKNQNAWGIEDRNSYVRVYSRKQKDVEIFANKPSSEENGISAINDYLKANKLIPTVIVHRGHSFHTESTLQRIPVSTRLLFIGSCGGFYKIPIALENAPDAHIIATKQVGTKTVNDIMLYALNENIREGKDIDWNEFWDKMHQKMANNQYFGDYVPPNKNIEAIFIRAYYKILGV